MTTETQITASLQDIVDSNTGNDDGGPCGCYEDGAAIATASFNYGVNLACEAVVAASVDMRGMSAATIQQLSDLIVELRNLRIPK